jgi:2-polyprenyl-6-methoxyphenol hydroxylase-like FAD-dependent oxidoreductase
MRVAIIGAGPTGLFTAVALARRGHDVSVVDRDPGPNRNGWWPRAGVMQFHHPHAYRLQVIEALQTEIPQAWDALLAAGAVPVYAPGQPGLPIAIRCRRAVFETVLRSQASAESRVTLIHAHATGVAHERGRAIAVRLGGDRILPADLVLDTSGRAGRLSRSLRAAAPESADCGLAYVSRQYRLRRGASEGPTNAPPGLVTVYPGYLAIVFPHDNRTFSTLIAQSSTDRDLAGLRGLAAFEAATRAIPPLAIWTDPRRSRPITPVLRGGHLYNSYRGQRNDAGRIALPGLIALGDAVCTTNPSLGRGIATSFQQAQRLVALLDEPGSDFGDVGLTFDDWCAEHIKPWFADHVYTDADLQRRWAGADVDVSRRLPSDLIVAAAEAYPELNSTIMPYVMMRTLPSSLNAIEPRVRDIYAGGWRPAMPEGPSRGELAELIARTANRQTRADRAAPRVVA